MIRVDDSYEVNLAHQSRGGERRFEDADGLWEQPERRKRAERRLPIVDEVSVSFPDWARSMARYQAKIRRQAKNESTTRQAKP